MELINNTTKTLRDDLSVEIQQGSKVSIAAACFSIYAFQELKSQLKDIDELRFIFTSPFNPATPWINRSWRMKSRPSWIKKLPDWKSWPEQRNSRRRSLRSFRG